MNGVYNSLALSKLQSFLDSVSSFPGGCMVYTTLMFNAFNMFFNGCPGKTLYRFSKPTFNQHVIGPSMSWMGLTLLTIHKAPFLRIIMNNPLPFQML
mmetsp:Transcript_13527/g.20553  ORF Transcript_13527/g.20553 Transcript_13527/m.20553 type:complete len:97 (+) Transcript_13527:203-493(+)